MTTGFWFVLILGLLVGLALGVAAGWMARGSRRRWVA